MCQGLGDQPLGRPFVVWVLGRLLTAFAALAGLEPAAGGTERCWWDLGGRWWA